MRCCPAPSTCHFQTSVRAAAIVALQRIVEGVSDTDGGVKCHVGVQAALDKAVVDKVPTVRAAAGNLVQALATASRGFSTVKLNALIAVCSKVR